MGRSSAETDRTSILENTIHTLCGAIVILTFPIAATLAVTNLLHSPLWSASRGLLIFGIVLVWIGMVAYFASIILARIKNPKAGEAFGPHVNMGWPNRFNVVTYMVWIMIIAVTALRL